MEPTDPDRQWSDEAKFKLVVETLRSNRTPSEIARENGVSPETLSDWIDSFYERGPALFEGESPNTAGASVSNESLGNLDVIPEMALVLDGDLRIQGVNETLEQELGFEDNDVVGEDIDMILAEESLSSSIRDLFDESERTPVNVNFLTIDGRRVPVLMTVSSELPENRNGNYLGLAREVSEFREIQRKLRTKKNRFRAIYEQAPVGLWEQDMSEAREYVETLSRRKGITDLGNFLEDNPAELREIASRIKTLSVNQRLLDILGAEDRDHLLQNLNNVFTEETYEVFREELVDFFEKGKTSYRNEVQVKTLDGENRTVLFSLNHPEIPQDDWSWVFVTYRDITERKRVQRELAKNEERFRQLAENVNSIFWIEDLETGENLYISPAVEGITGRSRKTFVRDPEAFLGMIHPEDHKRVKEAYVESRKHGFQPPAEYEEEYRIQRPDGEVRWLHDRAFPVRDDEGEVYRVAGIAEDVTDRKHMEQKLQESVEEKETLLQEVHHRVKNNMQIISSLLRLQSYQMDDEAVREEFLDCQQRVQSMVMVHEKLYQSERLSDLDVEEYLRELVESLVSSYTTHRTPEISFNIDEELQLVLDNTIACGLIVNELVSNSLEHGFDATAENPRIELDFRKHQNQGKLVVTDNGLGIPEGISIPNTDSLGLQLIDSITATQLNGDYDIRREDGTVVEVTFPLQSGGTDDGES